MRYACIAAAKGGARCRYLTESPGGLCSFHQRLKEEGREIKLAPKPYRVELKFNINFDRSQGLEILGVPRRSVDWVEKEERHIEHAHQFVRQPYRYREIADSGVPVFGRWGISWVSLQNIWDELQREGYNIQDVYLISRRDEKMDILVIKLNREGSGIPFPPRAEKERFELLSSAWEYVHVWANPPKDGKIVHTVNAGHRHDAAPRLSLCFNHGLWAVEPTAPL